MSCATYCWPSSSEGIHEKGKTEGIAVKLDFDNSLPEKTKLNSSANLSQQFPNVSKRQTTKSKRSILHVSHFFNMVKDL